MTLSFLKRAAKKQFDCALGDCWSKLLAPGPLGGWLLDTCVTAYSTNLITNQLIKPIKYAKYSVQRQVGDFKMNYRAVTCEVKYPVTFL